MLSLDFELYWGVRDNRALADYRENLLGVRSVVPRLLERFEVFEVHATWATVGFLFFDVRDELLASVPETLPAYEDRDLSPYSDLTGVGANENTDPFHFGWSLLKQIVSCPGQEIGTHTFSHYYCLEPGQDVSTFEADLNAAVTVAQKRGIELRSLVFPRNQVRPDYLDVCARVGIQAYRGTEHSWLYAPRHGNGETKVRRGLRLADAYLPLSGHNLFFLADSGELPRNVPSSRFLRPYSPRLRMLEPLRIRRVLSDLEHAARTGRAYHLWWHPHNFGQHSDANFAVLEAILERFSELRLRYGLRSLNMAEMVSIGNAP